MCAQGGASKGLPMRPLGTALFAIAFACPAFSAEVLDVGTSGVEPDSHQAKYLLGGSAARVALPVASAATTAAISPRLRLSVPRLVRETGATVQDTPIGGLRLYFGEAWTEGEDVFQFGTALTRGQATCLLYTSDAADD